MIFFEIKRARHEPGGAHNTLLIDFFAPYALPYLRRSFDEIQDALRNACRQLAAKRSSRER
jgi:hypothetical protein